MRMSIKEKEVLYAFGCPTYHDTIARLKTLATLTVDPNAQTMIERLIAKLSEKGVEKWYRCFFYNLRLEMEGYHNAERVIFLAETSTM